MKNLDNSVIPIWKPKNIYSNRIVDIIKKDHGKTLLKIVLSEGRNRQIRRVASALGVKVIDLKRTEISTIKLGNLKEGCWKELEVSEWQNLIE